VRRLPPSTWSRCYGQWRKNVAEGAHEPEMFSAELKTTSRLAGATCCTKLARSHEKLSQSMAWLGYCGLRGEPLHRTFLPPKNPDICTSMTLLPSFASSRLLLSLITRCLIEASHKHGTTLLSGIQCLHLRNLRSIPVRPPMELICLLLLNS